MGTTGKVCRTDTIGITQRVAEASSLRSFDSHSSMCCLIANETANLTFADFRPIFGLNPKLSAAMKAKILLTMYALCFLCTGCGLSHNLWQTSFVQPKQYNNHRNEKWQRHQFRKLARVELEKARVVARAESDNYACDPFSVDEECGFEAGFVDYLMYGGNGNPPPLPPRPYWKSRNQNCYQAAQDWFRGFQHGAAVARASGYRDCVTVQLNDVLINHKLPLYLGQVSDFGTAESVASQRSQIEGEDTANNLLVAEVDPVVAQPPVNNALPFPALPIEGELLPPDEEIALLDSSNPNDWDPTSGTGSNSQFVPAIEPSAFEIQSISTANRDSLGLEQLPPLRAQSNSPIQAFQPVSGNSLFEGEKQTPFKSLPPLPESGMLDRESTSASGTDDTSMVVPPSDSMDLAKMPATSLAASQRLSSLAAETIPDVDDLPEVALASFTEVESTGKHDTTDKWTPNTTVRRRWPIGAINLLLLAGILSAFRRRRKSSDTTSRKSLFPMTRGAFFQLLTTKIQKRQ